MREYDIHPLSLIFPPMSKGDFDQLASDISANGLLEPITLYEDQILDGRNRYRACVNTGVSPKFIDYEGDDPLTFVISKNLSRRHLDESQRAMVAAKLSNMQQGRPGKPANLPVYVSQTDAAEKLNVGDRSVRSARKVIESGDKDLIQAVENGSIAVSVAEKIARLDPEEREQVISASRPEQAIKKATRQKKEVELAQRQTALPQKKYGVIYADPEWKFETFSENGMDRSADNHYPTSVTDDICQRPVWDIAAEDSVLFLWATVPMIKDAFKVMDAWGFTYKSQAIWVKDRIGTGYWFRNKHEILLVGTKGKIPAPAMGDQFNSIIEAPLGAHSEKPKVFHEMIEAYFPTLPKIELNARDAREGWDIWGYEAPIE